MMPIVVNELVWDLLIFSSAALIGVVFYFISSLISTSTMRKYLAPGRADERFEYATAANDTWRTVAQIIGGAAFGLTFAWTMVADRGNDQRGRDQQANQLYIDASKLTASASITERSAGAFALGLVAADRPSFAPAVRDLLVTMIASQFPGSDKTVPFHRQADVGLDTQAAIKVLGQRDEALDGVGQPLNLTAMQMPGGKFHLGRSWARTLFYRANLVRADFSGATLDGARFDGAILADFEGYGYGGSSGAVGWTDDVAFVPDRWLKWERYIFAADFRGASLKDATFTNTGIEGALFSYADLTGTDFSGANVSRADFRGAHNVELARFFGACYGGELRNRPIFDSTVKLEFDDGSPGIPPVAVNLDGKIHIIRC